MLYNHTQVGRLMVTILFIIAVYFVFIFKTVESDRSIIAVLILVLFILLSFVSLNVRIDEKHLRIKFGYGIFRKRFALSEIISVKAVKNHWYYGWGIRVWFWPLMHIFNVSGFDAVEIRMKDSKIYRIGTDESQKLELAITEAIK